MQFHILSFEGPDAYSRSGGLASRVEGLTDALAAFDFETHLWFIGDPDLPGHEVRGNLHLHRWAQWISRHHEGGVYDGEVSKEAEYAASLPPFLMRELLAPSLERGGQAVILAEEWQTANAVLHLHWLLRYAGLRDRVTAFWNANNTFGFHGIAWDRLAEAATITTVSRYMKHRMRDVGVDALVVPNGLPPEAYEPPDGTGVTELRRRFRRRTLLAKMARWDPDKRWLASVDIVAHMKQVGWRPLLLARGGSEPHGQDVLTAARDRGLSIVERTWREPGPLGMLKALRDLGEADIVLLGSHVDPDARRVLFKGCDAVLANSDHEPFGLVGLETMAAGGLACTGCSGEDYAVPGQNALVLQSGDPVEFVTLYGRLRERPEEARAIRKAGRSTAMSYAWSEVVERVLLPRLGVAVPRRPKAERRKRTAAEPKPQVAAEAPPRPAFPEPDPGKASARRRRKTKEVIGAILTGNRGS